MPLVLVTKVQHTLIDQLSEIQKRHITRCNSIKDGSLRSVNISNKFTSFQC